MTFWSYLKMVLLFGAVSVGFAVTVTLLTHFGIWLFRMGRKTAKHNPWR